MSNNETSANTNDAIQKITSIPLVASTIQYFESKTPPVLQKGIDSFQELVYKINASGQDFIPFLIVFVLVYFASYQIYLGLSKDEDSSHDFTKYLYVVIVPIILLFCYIIHVLFDKNTEYSVFAILGLIVGIMSVFYFVVYHVSIFQFSKENIIPYILMGFIVIVGLMIIYNIFEKKLRSFDTTMGFIVNLIFYIPCLLNMFIEYLAKDLINTNKMVVVLFIVEIVLIILYFFVVPLVQKSFVNDGIILLKEPVYLNRKNDSLTAEILKSSAHMISDPKYQNDSISSAVTSSETSTTTPGTSTTTPTPTIFTNITRIKNSFRKIYSISMWVYLNPMPNTRFAYNEESNIFYYGTKSDGTTQNSYHPAITMKLYDGVYQCMIYYAGKNAKHKIEIPFQKWNHFVFNYREGGVDLFLNGKLFKSYSYSTNELPNYSENDKIEVGDELTIYKDKMIGDKITKIPYTIDGLYGAICNVAYYKRPLLKSEIVRNYNLLFYKNPPI